MHEKGGFGSIGYRAPWHEEESRKLLLRTHTTASSAAMLYELAARCRGASAPNDEGEFAHGETHNADPRATKPAPLPKDGKKDDGFRPAKLFSIDRVFRNETMDATHLAEFHQVEGVVADRGLTLADLIGQSFFDVSWRASMLTYFSSSARLHARLFQENGDRECAFQACVQSIYGGWSYHHLLENVS